MIWWAAWVAVVSVPVGLLGYYLSTMRRERSEQPRRATQRRHLR